MGDFKDPAMQRYFNGLPAYLQESIKQSAVPIYTLAQLEKIAGNLTQKQ